MSRPMHLLPCAFDALFAERGADLMAAQKAAEEAAEALAEIFTPEPAA